MIKFIKNAAKKMYSKYFSSTELQCRCQLDDCINQQFSPSLLKKLDNLREQYGKPLTVNRGYSCVAHNKSVGGSATSHHCKGDAIDFRDVDGSLHKFLTIDKLEELGLYMEHRKHTPTWCHLQEKPPGSGNRIFTIK